MIAKKVLIGAGFGFLLAGQSVGVCQDVLPRDNGMATYHIMPRYRESESHPLRVLAYMFHPVGWVAREAVFRPLSYFASSSETRRSVMGFREPFDYREPQCFSSDDSIPDCRSVAPFNYQDISKAGEEQTPATWSEPERFVYFPDVNFEFDKAALTDLGKGRLRQVSALLSKESGLHVVLEGHADFMGSDQYNEALGMRRAEAVRQGLIELGLDAARLSTVTFGESTPILPEQEDWARAVNRRVALRTGD